MFHSNDIDQEIDRRIAKSFKEPRIKDKDLFEVVEEVFDRATVLAIIELKRRKCLKSLKGVVSAGKEARVYWGRGFDGSELAVKIYLTATAEFKKGIWKYIQGDPRYEWVASLPSHKLMSVWARKEFSNLKRMYRVGINVPTPICVYRNVLVMKFIGENGVRAPLLKEVYEAGELGEDIAEEIFKKLIETVYRLYWEAKLVHGDLSEYNVMLFKGEPYIIDVSQAITVDHPNSTNFLYRDISNIVRFFTNEVGLEVSPVEEIVDSILNKRLAL
ncbi:MAG: serine protein kinase RIO [Ignisphaera sp.]